MRLEQQSNVLGKWYYPVEHRTDNGYRLVDLRERTGHFHAQEEPSTPSAHVAGLDHVLMRKTPYVDVRNLFGMPLSILTTVHFFSASRYRSTRETEEFLFN
ncbi:hypothetical protein RB195_024872 [Necator americanus]|uniref:Uncharacterized protein n=1 Tax=Necator americanus TaxID=51031 RepID=A0ABR1EPX0_NECAM